MRVMRRDTKFYRGVVELEHNDGVISIFYGPYARKGDATLATQRYRGYRRGSRRLNSFVEETTPVWEAVK